MTLDKAKHYAFKLLAYRPRSTQEVKDYLENKKFNQDVIEQVITYLLRLSYLDDEQFCNLWIKNRIKLKPMGRERLYNELLQKGVDPSIIEHALSRNVSEEIELSLVRDLIMKKLMRTNANIIDRQKERLKSFLYRRGFSPAIIDRVISEIFH